MTKKEIMMEVGLAAGLTQENLESRIRQVLLTRGSTYEQYLNEVIPPEEIEGHRVMHMAILRMLTQATPEELQKMVQAIVQRQCEKDRQKQADN